MCREQLASSIHCLKAPKWTCSRYLVRSVYLTKKNHGAQGCKPGFQYNAQRTVTSSKVKILLRFTGVLSVVKQLRSTGALRGLYLVTWTAFMQPFVLSTNQSQDTKRDTHIQFNPLFPWMSSHSDSLKKLLSYPDKGKNKAQLTTPGLHMDKSRIAGPLSFLRF